jgi:Domain of unknown function (DUF4405)
MKQTKRNLWLDLAIFVALLVATTTGLMLWLVMPHRLEAVLLGSSRRVWVAAHICSGAVGLAGIVMHIVRHWNWLKALRGRRLSGLPEKLRANRVVDRIMWITYIATNVFGAMAWALQFGNDVYAVSVPERLHAAFGATSTMLVAAHLALHWKWVTSATRRHIAPALG